MVARAVSLAVTLITSVLLLGLEPRPAVLQSQAAVPDLRIEDVGVRVLPDMSGQETTISFRVRNAGAEVVRDVQTEVFPGIAQGTAPQPFSISTAAIASGETVYFSRTITVAAGSPAIDASITIKTPGGGGLVYAKTTVPFLSRPPAPGKWVSIGPRLITAPANPQIGLGSYAATGRLAAIAVHPTNPKIIYVGSPGELGHEGCGLWKTSNGGISWQPVAESLPTLSIAAVAIDPTSPDRVYVVAPDYGLYKSENAGISWQNVHTSLGVKRNTRDGDRTVLLVDPIEPNVLFVTSEFGVLRSDNSGVDWFKSTVEGSATALVMDPQDHNVLYAAIQDNGVYKTTNGGKWLPNGTNGWALESLPSDGARNKPDLGILLAIARPTPESPATVYALLGAPYSGMHGRVLYQKLEDRGWVERYSCGAIEWNKPNSECLFNVMAVDPNLPNRVYIGGPLLRVSTDNGAHFTRIPQVGREDRQPYGPHGDYHGWSFDPTDAGVIFAATDGGIYRSSDHGSEGSWSFIGTGITNTELYDLVSGYVPPRWLFAGTQDNGTMLYSGSVFWDHIYPAQPTALGKPGYGGDGALVAMDPLSNNVLYLMQQFQDSLVKSSDAGQTDFQGFAAGLPSHTDIRCAAFDSSFYFQLHPANPFTLLATCGAALYQTTSNAPPGNWGAVFSAPEGRLVRSAVDGGAGIYYVGTTATSPDDNYGIGAGAGIVYAGKPSGRFQTLFEHPDHLPVSDIDVDPLHPESVYVSFARRYQVNRGCTHEPQARVFRATRSSAARTGETVTVTDITGQSTEAGQTGLPVGLCVNTLVIDPRPPLTLYVGTQDGVYRGRARTTGGQSGLGESWSWTPYNDGMPHTDVRDLELHPERNLMYAATYGRGAFEVFLSAVRVAPK